MVAPLALAAAPLAGVGRSIAQNVLPQVVGAAAGPVLSQLLGGGQQQQPRPA